MKTSKRRTFSAEFKLEAASLVTEQGYSVKEASKASKERKGDQHGGGRPKWHHANEKEP